LLNWIYLSWKYLLRIILFGGIVLFFLAIILFSVIQLPFLQSKVAGHAERLFNSRFDSQLTIGQAKGLIPFSMELEDVLIQRSDTLIFVKSLTVKISPLDFFLGQIGIQSIVVKHPQINLSLDSEGVFYELERAFQSKTEAGTGAPLRLSEYEIFAPFIAVENGRLTYNSRQPGVAETERKPPIEVTDIQLSAFIESTNLQRYADFALFQFSIPEISGQPFAFRGQVYNDERFLELNSFVFEHAHNVIRVSGEVDGLNLSVGPINEQLQTAGYALRVDTLSLFPSDFRSFFPDLPSLKQRIVLDFEAEGTFKEMIIRRSTIRYGRSIISFIGDLKEIESFQNFSYDGNIRQVNLHQSDLTEIFPHFRKYRFQDWNTLTLSGRVSGDFSQTIADLNIATRRGSVIMEGDIRWSAVPVYNLNLSSAGLDFSQFSSLSFKQTNINGEIGIRGRGLVPGSSEARFVLNLNNTSYNEIQVDEIIVDGSLLNDNLIATLEILSGGSSLFSSMEASISNAVSVKIDGYGTSVNPNDFFKTLTESEIKVNFDYTIDFIGTGIDDLVARVSLDVSQGTVNGQNLPVHQIYADLFDESDGSRRFRMTSSVLDLNVSGNLYPLTIAKAYKHWAGYINNRVSEEIFLEDVDNIAVQGQVFDGSLNLEFDFFVRDTVLIKQYVPNSPLGRLNVSGEGRVQSNGTRILVSGGVRADEFHFNDLELRQLDLQFTGNLNHNRMFRDFAAIDFQLGAKEVLKNSLPIQNLTASGSMLDGKINIMADASKIGDENYGLGMTASATLADSMVFISLKELSIGHEAYRWELQESVEATYSTGNTLEIGLFKIVNNAQVIDIWGVLSPNPADSVNYRISNLNIGSISSFLGGRLSFDGFLDGNIVTRSLLTEPVVAGDVRISELQMDGRTLGDLKLTSVYSTEFNRFNTRLEVYTDPERYAQYLQRNDGVGQHIIADGWFKTGSADLDSTNSLYRFDVELLEIDGWILQPIIPSIFVSTEGRASGRGFIAGNFQQIDFNAVFDVQELQGVADFLMTEYTFAGQVEVDRYDGILINNVAVRDRFGGSGLLSGIISFNDFLEERPFNLSLSMDRLQFLNNSFDPEVPFYGNVSGTGLVTLTGSNITPFIRTVTPVSTTPDSRLTIPLLPETVFDEQSRFVEFVRSFDEVFTPRTQDAEHNGGQIQQDRTFAETFRLDLQFIAPPRTTVQLLFDPVTNEVLNARGSGRIRVTLEDQVFQMFGGFNVNSGDYTFVGGDIFVRRFQLRDGGTINWEGDPANARLNITASYRTRPNIGILTGAAIDQQTRIPIDLILDITGTIQAIENDFYFEFPNAVDVTQNATELALLNSEDQKLLQATSLLFTGSFLPVGTAAESQFSELSNSLQARAGQVGLSQLLSNQINNLLSSSLSILDVDLNLTGFDQADLGVALRLFDDRLVLRGESQFFAGAETGAETTLGDFGVTYSISRNLSLEVFHRRDPTLRSIVGNQSQAESINGIGLEAQIQFNTWSELRFRILRQLRRLFGIRPEQRNELPNIITENSI
jgi:translocation and assembly module TamB